MIVTIKKISWLIANIDGIKKSFTPETFSVISRHLKTIEGLPIGFSMETFGLDVFLDFAFSKNVQN